ncbi:MAG: aminotransferase class I/II-fold pyridoxal phosphate-dependent enzyme [Bacteroidota bacterium]
MDLSFILNHLGEDREHYFQAISPPVFQTSNFNFPTVESFRKAIADEQAHHIYTRGNNPTTEILRKKMAALEKAEDALVFGSGAGAIAAAVIGNVAAGDHVVCVQSPYSWTYRLLTLFLVRFGVTHTFVDGRDINAIKTALQPNTKVLYLESPNTMTFELQDLKACAELARNNGLVSIIDNSYCSPYFQNPIDCGIDIVVHSGTKYLNGHSDVVVGVLCGSKAMVKKLFNSEFLTLGGILGPHDAALVIRGLRTLPLRMERSHSTCHQIVEWMKAHPKVEKVYYPFDPDFPQYDLARKQMRGSGGLFSVELKADSIQAMEAFVDSLDRFFIAASWGGYESLIVPICAMYGVKGKDDPTLPWNFIRFYIGLEEPESLLADLRKAFEKL